MNSVDRPKMAPDAKTLRTDDFHEMVTMKADRRRFGGLFGLLAGAALGAVFSTFFLETAKASGAREALALAVLVWPVICAVLGSVLGSVFDRLYSQTKMVEHQNRLLHAQVILDDVTGVFHYDQLLRETDKEIERSRRYGRVLSVAMFDVEGFTEINAKYGNAGGDELLRGVAGLLAGGIRKIDLIGRCGGCKFLVVLPSAGDKDAKRVAERLCSRVTAQSLRAGRARVDVRVTVGVVTVPDIKNVDSLALVRMSDEALAAVRTSNGAHS